MPDIFDEVEEDLRADQVRAVLGRYGVLFLAALVLVLAAVGAWQAWQWRQHKLALHTAGTYFAAADLASAGAAGAEAGRPDAARRQALAGFESVARKGSAGFRALATLRQAALLAGAGDAAGAEALWLKLADDEGADQLLRDAATVQWATHALDTADPGLLEVRLQKLARPENPFHGLAQEVQALLALRQGQTASALATLRQIAQDDSAPQGVRQRAAALASQLAATTVPARAGTAPAGSAPAGSAPAGSAPAAKAGAS